MPLVKPNESNLVPLNSEETRKVATYVWQAIVAIPKHRHNRNGRPEDCETCIAYNNLILAFRMFKRTGEK